MPQPRGVFSTVLLKSVAVCLYAAGRVQGCQLHTQTAKPPRFHDKKSKNEKSKDKSQKTISQKTKSQMDKSQEDKSQIS